MLWDTYVLPMAFFFSAQARKGPCMPAPRRAAVLPLPVCLVACTVRRLCAFCHWCSQALTRLPSKPWALPSPCRPRSRLRCVRLPGAPLPQSELRHLALCDLDRRILVLFFCFNVSNTFLGSVLGGAVFQQIGAMVEEPGGGDAGAARARPAAAQSSWRAGWRGSWAGTPQRGPSADCHAQAAHAASAGGRRQRGAARRLVPARPCQLAAPAMLCTSNSCTGDEAAAPLGPPPAGFWLTQLGTSLPTASTYFLNYIMIHALSTNFFRFIWCARQRALPRRTRLPRLRQRLAAEQSRMWRSEPACRLTIRARPRALSAACPLPARANPHRPHEGTVLFVIFRAIGLFREPQAARVVGPLRAAAFSNATPLPALPASPEV